MSVNYSIVHDYVPYIMSVNYSIVHDYVPFIMSVNYSIVQGDRIMYNRVVNRHDKEQNHVQ
jgi:hypothetical protein